MSKLWKITGIAAIGLAGVAFGIGTWLYFAASQQPDFYRQAMKIDPADQHPAGRELERGVAKLQKQARTPGKWTTTFTEEQINGWLATELPQKFPNVLPNGVANPRVAIHEGGIQVAAQYVDGLIAYVVSFSLELELTNEPNTVAVTVHQVRAGSLSVPIRQFLDRISRAAGRGRIPLRWAPAEGDPIAYVTIPDRHEDYVQQEIVIETIELRDGKVFLAGRTDAVPPTADIAQRLPAESAREKLAIHW